MTCDPKHDTDWRQRSMSEIADHLIDTHHLFRRELPRISEELAGATRAFGEYHPELVKIGRILAAVAEDLDDHMRKSEAVFFPAVRSLEATDRPAELSCAPNIECPIRRLGMEHEIITGTLGRVRQLARSITPDADSRAACESLVASLDALEDDLRHHVELERDVLFPRASALDAERRR